MPCQLTRWCIFVNFSTVYNDTLVAKRLMHIVIYERTESQVQAGLSVMVGFIVHCTSEFQVVFFSFLTNGCLGTLKNNGKD